GGRRSRVLRDGTADRLSCPTQGGPWPAIAATLRYPRAKARPIAMSTIPPAVLLFRDIPEPPVRALLASHALELVVVSDGAPSPGSYWGEPEAGIIGSTVSVRPYTPVHSLLHEACHLIVLPPRRRAAVHSDATDSVDEENAVLVLQVLLSEQLPGVGRDRAL